MGQTIDYDALIEERHHSLEEIAQRRGAERLAEIAQNLESLAALADATPQTPPIVPAAGTPQGDPA